MLPSEKLALRVAAYVVAGLVTIWLLIFAGAWGYELFPAPDGPPPCDYGTYNVYPGSPSPRCVPNGQVDP